MIPIIINVHNGGVLHYGVDHGDNVTIIDPLDKPLDLGPPFAGLGKRLNTAPLTAEQEAQVRQIVNEELSRFYSESRG